MLAAARANVPKRFLVGTGYGLDMKQKALDLGIKLPVFVEKDSRLGVAIGLPPDAYPFWFYDDLASVAEAVLNQE